MDTNARHAAATEFQQEVLQFIGDLACYGQPEHAPLSIEEQQSVVRRAICGAAKLRRHPGFVLLQVPKPTNHNCQLTKKK